MAMDFILLEKQEMRLIVRRYHYGTEQVGNDENMDATNFRRFDFR